MEKQCTKCGNVKPLDLFHRIKRKSGYRPTPACKQCCSIRAREYYIKNKEPMALTAKLWKEANKEKIILFSRNWARRNCHKNKAWRDKNKEKLNSHREKYRQNNRLKTRARSMVSDRKKSGKLKLLPCQVCGTNEAVEAHHEDYSKPLEIRWLCSKHHHEHHINKRKRERLEKNG